MANLEEFRAGTCGVPFSCPDELPAGCFTCWCLSYEESEVCYCGEPFYYYCCYSWSDKLAQTVPPCLTAPEGEPAGNPG